MSRSDQIVVDFDNNYRRSNGGTFLVFISLENTTFPEGFYPCRFLSRMQFVDFLASTEDQPYLLKKSKSDWTDGSVLIIFNAGMLDNLHFSMETALLFCFGKE